MTSIKKHYSYSKNFFTSEGLAGAPSSVPPSGHSNEFNKKHYLYSKNFFTSEGLAGAPSSVPPSGHPVDLCFKKQFANIIQKSFIPK